MERLPVIVERPLIFVERPLIFVERPLIFMERPLIFMERPLIFVERPLAETSGLSTNGLIIKIYLVLPEVAHDAAAAGNGHG